MPATNPFRIPPAQATAFARALGLGMALDAPPVVSPSPRDAAEQRRATRYVLLGLLLVVAIHVWIISAGWITTWPQYSCYYDRQSEGFRHGQTSLLTRPNARLLTLPDPYDPDANRAFRRYPGVHDTVLFNNKFYLYWGPAPALLLVPIKMIAGRAVIGDQYLVFAFTLGTMLFTALLLRLLWARFFPEQAAWTLFLGIVVAGLAAPIGYLLARSAIYEAAIMGGQCFLLAGLYALCAGGLDFKAHPPHPLRLAGVGTCWAMAVGSRISLAVAVVGLAAWVAAKLIIAAQKRWSRIHLLCLASLVAPLLGGAISLGAYNYVRFGSWHEFGQKYQLTAANYRATPSLFSPANILPSLYSYSLRPPHVSRAFPLVEAQGGGGTFPSFLRLPGHYEFNEPITGLLLVTPFLWLSAIAAARLLPNRRCHSPSQPGPDPCAAIKRPASKPREHELNSIVVALLIAAILGFAPVLLAIGSTMRYLADLTPCLMIVAVIGMWQRGRQVAARPGQRRLFASVVLALAAWSVGVGLLLSITGYYWHFQTFNPKWFAAVSSKVDSLTGR